MVILSAKKKMPFLSDPNYLKYKGFILADRAKPYYELMYLPFSESVEKPCFKEAVKTPRIDQQGYVLYYTHQCPYTAKYVSLIEAIAKSKGVEFSAYCFETTEQAQNSPAPSTSYSLFYNGAFVTNEILSEKKFEKMISNPPA